MGEPILGITSVLRKGLRKMAYSPSDEGNGEKWLVAQVKRMEGEGGERMRTWRMSLKE